MAEAREDRMLVERSRMGVLRHRSDAYGASCEGAGLTVWLPHHGETRVLVLAAMHGDEPETTVVVSEALRAIHPESLRNAAVLCGNPDGLLRGTRGNARGVDLNRNFPSTNWSPETVPYKSRKDGPRDIDLSPGEQPASEPETTALIALIDRLRPEAVLTLHAALACVDGAEDSMLAWWLAERSGLPLEPVSYPTPGSFGSWAGERGIDVVTYELEAASLYDLKERHVPILIDVLTGAVGPEG
jgi:protein MpaA